MVTFQIRYNLIIASPSYGEVTARDERVVGEVEKKEERPLSRQQVADSSPYRRGAIAGEFHPLVRRCRDEMPRLRALTLIFHPTISARCSA